MKEWYFLVFFWGALFSQALAQDNGESSSSSRCGKNWVEDPLTGLCYRLTDEQWTYNSALEKCESFAGKTNLCSINSPEEQFFISSLLAYRNVRLAWIGFKKINGNWEWADGSSVTYKNWGPLQPSHKPRYYCAYVSNYYKWTNQICDLKLVGCCKKKPDDHIEVLSSVEDSMWINYEGKAYKTISLNKTWKEAENYCETLNAKSGEKTNLVSIHSSSEQTFVNGLIDTIHSWWIGISGTVQSTTSGGGVSGFRGPLQTGEDKVNWQWTDGSTVKFTYWTPEVDYSNFGRFFERYYGYFTKDSYWLAADIITDDPRYFVCQKTKE